MSLSSLQLDAFQWVAQEKSFSKAAERLHVTQSALSQRIQKLESELELALLVRKPSGVELTEAGVRLLQYCQVRESLETEFLNDIAGDLTQGLGGVLRIAAHSSVMRSVIQPCLSPLVRENPGLQLQFIVAQVPELSDILLHGEAEFIVTDHVLDRAGVESYVLGQETYIMIESARHKGREDVFIDQTIDDHYSHAFIKRQGERVANIKRSFAHDIYGILDAVQEGVGRAVVPKHTLKNYSGLRRVSQFKEQSVPVVLHFFQQPYYSTLMQTVIDRLNEDARKFL